MRSVRYFTLLMAVCQQATSRRVQGRGYRRAYDAEVSIERARTPHQAQQRGSVPPALKKDYQSTCTERSVVRIGNAKTAFLPTEFPVWVGTVQPQMDSDDTCTYDYHVVCATGPELNYVGAALSWWGGKDLAKHGPAIHVVLDCLGNKTTAG